MNINIKHLLSSLSRQELLDLLSVIAELLNTNQSSDNDYPYGTFYEDDIIR